MSKTPVISIDPDEIIRTLQELSAKEEMAEGFVTVQEIRKATGWGVEKIRELLNILKEEGRLESRYKKMISLDNRFMGRPAYRLIPEREEEEKNE